MRTCEDIRFIVRKARFPSRWKVRRVTPLHKQNLVKDPANYCRVTVLNNLSNYFESVIDNQLYAWISHFIPDSGGMWNRGLWCNVSLHTSGDSNSVVKGF